MGLNRFIRKAGSQVMNSMASGGKSLTLGRFANDIKKRQKAWTAKGDPITEEELISGLKEEWASPVNRKLYTSMGITFDELVEAGKQALTDTSELLPEPSGTVVKLAEKIGRNMPCPCGSGKKYKKCCGS